MIRKITNILLVLAMIFGFNIFKIDNFGMETAKAANAALTISISQDKTLMLEGDTTPIKATVNVKNTSSIVADHVRIDLPIAGNMTVDENSINEGGQLLGDKITWLLPDMATGAKFDLTYKFQLGITPAVQKYYVATNGKDSDAGTLEAPLATIKGARDRIRDYKKSNKSDRPIEVNIKAGRYYFDSQVNFTADDSGTSQNPITYKNFGDGEVVFVGGSKVTSSWGQVSGKPYFKTNIGIATKPNNLIVNGVQATLAKDPNSSYYIADSFITSSDQTTPLTSLSKSNCEYIKRDADDTSSILTNPTDVRVHAYVTWNETSELIKSINTETGIIKTYITKDGPDPATAYCYNGGYTIFVPGTEGKIRYTLENVFEKLDNPGEWYFDRASGDLFYQPRPGDNMASATVETSKIPTILSLSGTNYMNIEGIKFTGTQTDYVVSTKEDNGNLNETGAINVVDSSYVKVKGNTFYGTGGDGIYIRRNISNYNHILIEKNNFDSVGVSPVYVYGNIIPEKVVLECSRTTPCNSIITPNHSAIINNKFTNSGTIKTTQVINVSNSSGFLIENNDINGAGYTGIRLSYTNTWPEDALVPNVTFDSRLPLVMVSKNRVKNVMQKLNDGAGIYAYHARNVPVSINNNIVSNIVATGFHYDCKIGFGGIYLDNGQSNASITNNLVYNSSVGLNTNMTGVNNRVVNNIFAKIIDYGFHSWYVTKDSYDGGVTPRKGDAYINDKLLIRNNIVQLENNASPVRFRMAWPMIRYSGKNLFYPNLSTSKIDILFPGEYREYKNANVAGELSVETDSKSADPLFVDPGTDKLNNFSLKSDSPAFGLGFKAIDFSKVGTNW